MGNEVDILHGLLYSFMAQNKHLAGYSGIYYVVWGSISGAPQMGHTNASMDGSAVGLFPPA